MQQEILAEVPGVTDMQLDLNPQQKIRAAALIMAIRYYTDTIIKDGDYLRAMMEKEREMKFSNDPNAADWSLRPANSMAVVRIAGEFAAYLLGEPSSIESVTLIDPDNGARTEV